MRSWAKTKAQNKQQTQKNNKHNLENLLFPSKHSSSMLCGMKSKKTSAEQKKRI